MKIPKKIISKYQDVYYKDMSKFTEQDWKKYDKFLKEIKDKDKGDEENNGSTR